MRLRKLRPRFESLESRELLAAGPLGMNVGTPEFVDAIKQSNGFSSPTDSRGWPTTDTSIVVFDDRVNQPWNGPDPNASQPDMSGTYHLSFQGQATISAWPASVQNVSYNASTNTTTADVIELTGNPFLMLNFSNTRRNPGDSPGDGITNVRLIRPGYDPNTTQEFTNRYLAALKPFNTIRTMEATQTDYIYGPNWAGTPLNWSQRHLPTDAGVGPAGDSVAGTSWEDLIALANATHTNLWINIPGPATDDYVTQLANLINYGDTVDGIYYPGLDPSLKVYVEWSNEVWGGITSTYDYNVADINQQVQAGNSLLTSDGTPVAYDAWSGPTLLRNDLLHTERIAADFNVVFNDPYHTRIRPALEWQEGNLWAFPETFTWFQSNFGAPSQYLYGMGGATYYYASDYSSVDNLLNSLSASEQALIPQIQATTALASQYGLKNVAYEGGPAIDNTGDAGQVGLAALRDPRMERIVYQSYIDWYTNGGDQANFYSGPYGIWGPQWPWAAAELGQANNPAASPKYAGLLDVINASPINVPAASSTSSGAAASSTSSGAAASSTSSDPAASFLGSDTTTQGNWIGSYGSDGYNVIGSQANYPSYATVTPSGNSTYVWNPGPTDIRALQTPQSGSTTRIAACWYSDSGQITVDLNLNDGQAHRVSVYACDWDTTSRSERIDVVDPTTNAVLDSQTISSFSGGVYLSWEVQGHVQLVITRLSGAEPVISGLFFGG